MKNRIFQTMVVVLIATVMAISSIPTMSVLGGKPSKEVLTQKELDFADAVDPEYAWQIDEILAYSFGSVTDEYGRELWRPTGTEAGERAANWIASEFEDIGLQNVAIEPFPCHGYEFKGASVQMVSPVESEVMLAAGHGGLPGTVGNPYVADYVDEDGFITSEIVYVGLGRAMDYEGLDVSGKLVAVDVSSWEMYWLNYPHYEAELHGAIGLVVHWIEYQQFPGSIYTCDSECRPTIPAVVISHIDFAKLKEQMLNGPVTVKVWCDATIDYNAHGNNVVGYIPGTTHPDELIVLGAIYDKWWYGSTSPFVRCHFHDDLCKSPDRFGLRAR